MARVLLISEKTLKSNGVINNNVDGMYILPAIEYAQDAGLQPIIGTKLYNKLMDLVADGSIQQETDYKVLLDEYVTPSLLNKVTADIQIPLNYKLRNQGVVQNQTENTIVPTMKDIQYVIQNYEYKAIFYGNRLSDYLIANKCKFPEYSKVDSSADMHSNPNSYKTNIYLG